MHAFLKTVSMSAWLAWCSSVAHADEPPELPRSHKISSGSRNCWAYTDAEAERTTAYRRSKSGKRIAIWSVPAFFRVAALSRDCTYFVTGYDGVNVVPVDYDPSTVMLTFYRNGEAFASVELATLIRDLSKLQRTASHFYWGEYIGLERGHFYRVETVDRGQILFDMTTGQAL